VVKRAVVAAGAAVVVYLAWGWIVPSAEDRVRAAVHALAETLSSDGRDPIGQVAALGRLRAQLTDDVVVSPGPGTDIRGRDAVAGMWQRVRASGDAVRVRVLDLTVAVAEDGASATADGVAELSVERNGVPERELREVRATFVATGTEWRLQQAAVVDVVTPP
jgi:ketosteroid isomerase-like protein